MARKSTNNPRQKRRRGFDTRRVKAKPCSFCKERVGRIDWKDVGVLRKYMSDRAKIRPRRVTGTCPRHQRELAVAIKNAREMALVPYISTK